MKKELEALERLYTGNTDFYNRFSVLEDKNIIKSALERLEKVETENAELKARNEKLENFVNVCKKYEMYGTGDAVLIDLSTMSMVLSVPEEDRKILKEFFGEKK